MKCSPLCPVMYTSTLDRDVDRSRREAGVPAGIWPGRRRRKVMAETLSPV